MKCLTTPFNEEEISELETGDMLYISGEIFCGRDAVLPLIVNDIKMKSLDSTIYLKGSVIFHTAVSSAGVGPTSSNKVELENSMIPLSELVGVKMHLGKGKIGTDTVEALAKHNAVYAIVPPVTALLTSKIKKVECIAYAELGMEAFYRITVEKFPIIIAAAKGRSIYDRL